MTTFYVTHLQLCDLYENDSIFDKFECCLSREGNIHNFFFQNQNIYESLFLMFFFVSHFALFLEKVSVFELSSDSCLWWTSV